jgi:hypothetical protein
MTPIVFTLAVLVGLILYDPNMGEFILLQWKRFELAAERLAFMAKLRFEMWQIRNGFQDKKFKRMADELIKELTKDDSQ